MNLISQKRPATPSSRLAGKPGFDENTASAEFTLALLRRFVGGDIREQYHTKVGQAPKGTWRERIKRCLVALLSIQIAHLALATPRLGPPEQLNHQELSCRSAFIRS